MSPYLTDEYYGKWGMDKARRCPMGKANWGENAVWVGIYYSRYSPNRAPFVFLNEWDGSTLTKKTNPFKITSVKSSTNYLMMLDGRRDHVYEAIVRWPWDTDYDGDGMNDSRGGVIAVNLGPYNMAQPKIHRGGCNVGLFDGHVEWIRYEEFWEIGSDGLPAHRYWYNNNRP